MRKKVLIFLVLLSVLSAQGFVTAYQADAASITVLDRSGTATNEITDGDSIQIQITVAQPATEPETIHVLFGDTIIGSCLVPDGDTLCKTDFFNTLGWYWNPDGEPQPSSLLQAANDADQVIAQATINVKPRPVVLVHGFISNWETWSKYLAPDGYLSSLGLKGYAVGDGQVPGVLNTGVITNPVGRTNSIAENAAILGEYISNVKAQTGAEMVDLVIHSMGGMISRYYIDRLMQERDVAQLIMLGSPMGGSNCSVLPAALGFFLPASIEIREGYMRGVFNQQITHRKGIEFYDLGGTAINDAFKSPCTDIPNDTVVSFNSINAILLQSSQLDIIHSDLTFSDAAFADFVQPLLQKPAGSFVPQPDPAPIADTDSPLEFTRVYTGHVDAGGSTEITINIEPDVTVASFALYDASRSVTTIVRGSTGNIIELDPQTNGFIQVDDPSSLLYLGYGFQNPRPGVWSVTVQATENTPATGTDFAISVYFIGGANLETSSGTLVPQLRDDVELRANVLLNGEALEITSAQAVIKNPNGEVETIDFPVGRNVAVVWKPNEAGTHAVDIVVTALAPDGSSIERTDFLAIEVQPDLGRPQVTLNLILLIAGIVLVLGLILFLLIRWLIRLTRRANS